MNAMNRAITRLVRLLVLLGILNHKTYYQKTMFSKLGRILAGLLLSVLIFITNCPITHASPISGIQAAWSNFWNEVEISIQEIELEEDKEIAEESGISLSTYQSIKPIVNWVGISGHQYHYFSFVPVEPSNKCIAYAHSRGLVTNTSQGYFVSLTQDTAAYDDNYVEDVLKALNLELEVTSAYEPVRISLKRDYPTSVVVHPDCLSASVQDLI